MKSVNILFFVLGFCHTLVSQSLDIRVLRTINRGNHPAWDQGMKISSWSVYAAMPLSVAGTWYVGYLNKDDHMKRNAYKSAMSIGVALLISTGLKETVKRKRPFLEYPDIIQRDKVGPRSFPSGHTTSAFATATALTLSHKTWKVAVPAYLYASFVGYSRMRLGVHYPSDVVGGIIIGIGSGFLVWKLDHLINGK